MARGSKPKTRPAPPGETNARRARRRGQPSAHPGGDTPPRHYERSHAALGLYRYIWAISGRAQILLALLSVVIFLLDLVPLELQRRIVNEAIGQKAFAVLLWLCGTYALTALLQGTAKLAWNVYRNSVGEATSRRLRLDTFAAALRHRPAGTAAREGAGISIILAEADPVGLFVATSISEPVLHAGVLISVFAYLLHLQIWMAAVALALFIPQGIFVPMAQQAINRRTEERIRVMRRLSTDIVAETAAGALRHDEGSFGRRVRGIYTLSTLRHYNVTQVGRV